MKQPTRVLIVDDQPAARQGLKAVLALCPGVQVIGEATNGQQALQSVDALRPDVVLMDIQMPIMNGLDATRLIKGHWPATKVVVLTAYASMRVEALAAGADRFIFKGETLEALQNAILEENVPALSAASGELFHNNSRRS
ncbi:MAG TPA: response regulator transcription factor [Caldilineaceae bacterium]|nr:response regulator transcription factor [Caldilineaceae bacterium]